MTAIQESAPELCRVQDLIDNGILEINDGYRVRNAELGPHGIPFVRGGDIGDGDICTKVLDHIRPELSDRVENKLTREGDVAFISKGTVGRVGRVRLGQPTFVFAPQVCYWRSLDNSRLDPTYLFYALRSADFYAHLNAVKTHGSMVADYVSLSDQRRFTLPIPEIFTQRRIADILGSLDDKIDLNRRMNETLEVMARRLFKSWFVDFDPVHAKAAGLSLINYDSDISNLFPTGFEKSPLGDIPRGWSVTTVGTELVLAKGVSYRSAELAASDKALVTLKSINRGGGYRVDGLKSYTGKFSPQQVVKPGELVIAQTDVTQAAEVIGKPALVLADVRFETLIASLDLIIARPVVGDLSEHFFYLLFLTPEFQSHVYGHTNGTTVLHLSKNGVPSYCFIRPTESVAKAFTVIVRSIFDQIAANELENRALSATRDKLLPRLLSGELANSA